MINILNKFFPLRKCHHIPKSPCLYYHLGQCLAPCINKISKEKYSEIIDGIKQFLKGNNKDIVAEVKSKIKKSSDELDFETAEEYKKILDSLNHINDRQDVELINNDDIDIFGYFIREGYISLAILIIRKGILIAKKNYVYELIGEIDEFLTNVIYQYYQHNLIPKEIVVGNTQIKESLDLIYENKVSAPTKGKCFELINVAQVNAKEGLDEHFMSARLDDDKLKILEDLGTLLKIKTPYRIELFDNSHLQGTNAIGAMVCFINGEPNKKMYRKFNIESENKKDDLSSMKEVLTRRYSRLKEENESFPDLILLDGGIEQIEIANEVMSKLNLKINLAGLAKSEKHRTNSLISSSGETIDLSNNKALFFMLTRMQDEVHRYAISTHINKRNKSMFASVFDDVPGLGDKRIESLIKIYPTMNDLKNASLIELEQIIPKDSANKLYNKLRGNKDE